MKVTFTTHGYIEVWAGAVYISRHRSETEAIESALSDGRFPEYQLRYPNKTVKAYGILNTEQDTVAPTAPTNLTATVTNGRSVQLTWGASTDNESVTGYQVWRDGSQLANTSLLEYLDAGLAPGTAYEYKIAGFDGAGNVSEFSSIVTGTTDPNQVPVWTSPGTITLPPNVAYSLLLTSICSDADGDPLTFSQASGTLPTGLTLNTTTKRIGGTPTVAGSYSATVRASDGFDTADLTLSFVVSSTADTTAPSVPTGLAGTGFSRQRIDLTWSASSDPTGSGQQTSGLAGYRLYRNGSLRATLGLVTSYSDTGLAAGTLYQYRLSAVDVAGNESAQCPAVSVFSLTNREPDWVTPTTLPTLDYSASPQTMRLVAEDDDGDAITYSALSLPAGWTLTDLTNPLGALLTIPAGASGTFSLSARAVDNYAPAAGNWDARKSAQGVVWAHRFDTPQSANGTNAELLASYTPPTNADYGEQVTFGVHPIEVCPHVGTESDGTTYFEVILLGAVLETDIPGATLTTYGVDTPAADRVTLTRTTNKLGVLTFPSSMRTLALTFEDNFSTFKVMGTGASSTLLYFDATGDPVDNGSTVSINVSAGSKQTIVASESNLNWQHCRTGSPDNPLQTIVIDESIDLVGRPVPGQPNTTWWPDPGWNPATPTVIPPSVYTVVVQYESGTNKWKDKLAVYKATYDPGTKLTTLVVRRAAIEGSSAAGRVEDDWVNRSFPSNFPAGSYIGRDNKGGWTRILAPLYAGDNGLPTDDPAVGGTLPLRRLYSASQPNKVNENQLLKIRTGYYGHADYHTIWSEANPFAVGSTPPGENSLATNGGGVTGYVDRGPYNGDEFWLSWKMKYSSSWALTDAMSKTWFLDCYQSEKNSQIVGNAPTATERRWRWYHNKGSDSNSKLEENDSYMPGSQWEATCVTGDLTNPADGSGVQKCWWPVLDEYVYLKLHIKAGHDNEIEYQYDQGVTLQSIVSAITTPVAQPLVVKCNNFPLAEGLSRNMDGTGGYFSTLAGEGNPNGLDPTTDGYFDNWELTIEGYGSFKIDSHVIEGGQSKFTLSKKRPLDTWPTSYPTVGARCKVSWWTDQEASARYNDTYIELYKYEPGDTDWVLVADLQHPISYARGTAPTTNPPGWNEFQPTGYANVDDNNMPPNYTKWIRTTEVILSHNDIAKPA